MCADHSSKLAGFGALAIILVLAFSTFAQQSVAVVLRQYIVKDSSPGLPRTERYEQTDGTTLLGQGFSSRGQMSSIYRVYPRQLTINRC